MAAQGLDVIVQVVADDEKDVWLLARVNQRADERGKGNADGEWHRA